MLLIIAPATRAGVLQTLAAAERIAILRLLHGQDALNGTDIVQRPGQPLFRIQAKIHLLKMAGLIQTRTQRAGKGTKKLSETLVGEIGQRLERARTRQPPVWTPARWRKV